MLTYTSWIEEKSELAHVLAKGSCGGTYADGAIILCTAISAMSSVMWVRKTGTDRKRFIEIVTKFPRPGFDPTTVSAPLLAQDKEYNWLRQRLGISDKALRYTGANDKSEDEIIKLCATIIGADNKKIRFRKYSYACLLYEHIRCGFIHTYRPTESATSGDALDEIFDHGTSNVTYVNYLESQGMRKIYFPLDWISEVAKNVAAGLDDECQQHGKFLGDNLDLAIPGTWWIDGP